MADPKLPMQPISGWAGLSYVSDASCAVAEAVADGADDERDARIAHLEGELSALRLALREPVARLYGVHPDDLAAGEVAPVDPRRFHVEPLRKLVAWMAERERQAADEASAQDHDPAGSAERQAICDREARSFREVIDRLLTVYPDLEPDRPEVPRGK